MDSKKRRGLGRGMRAALHLVVVLALAGIGYAGYQLYAIEAEYAKGERVYAEVRRQAEQAPFAVPTEAANGSAGAANESAKAAGEPQGQAPASQSPQAPRPNRSQMDFDKLRTLNPDTVGWITMDRTVIDYPVVQGKDNDYYLRRLYSGEKGYVGSIFMDAGNAPDFSDRNTLIFGHNMKSGSMFGTLQNFASRSYYEKHPDMKLYTPDGDHEVRWIAGYITGSALIPTNFESDEAFMAHVENAVKRSDFKTDIEVKPTDRLVTLCTCSYATDDARYVLIGVVQ